MSKVKRFSDAPTLSPARLSALADHVAAELGTDAGVVETPLADLRENPYQPRRTFDAEALRDLTDSIRRHGVLQPLIGRREPDGRVTLIAGHRRWRAAAAAGLTHAPVILRRDVSDADLQVLALVENLQREDLHPVEKARALGAVARRFRTQAEAAEALGMKRSALAMWLRVLDLGDEVLDVCATHPNCSLRMLLDLLALAPARRLTAAKRLVMAPPVTPAPSSAAGSLGEVGGRVFQFTYRVPGRQATLRVIVTTTARRAATTRADLRAALEAALDRLNEAE
ncbi:MAG: ParB/RepB/Spo0J family partition protein [Chloracidobacterium sp.]|nr:ParB/RepB/Spo0J family partition protein [Chloracidobacterium sp.]MDW8218307.1 ParB/RepB/Spo0J family partition protein [Acidobacteriota bacterium]